MIYLNDKRGFSLALTATFICIIMAILVSSFSSLAFFTRNAATTDYLTQQAYYNANSGVEYALFIIENSSVYTPLNTATWPAGTSFPCFGGTVTVYITPNVIIGGYDIKSTGTIKNMTITINQVHVGAGKIDVWQ